MPVSAMYLYTDTHDILLDQVWQFAQEDLPVLKAAIVAILDSLDDHSSAP